MLLNAKFVKNLLCSAIEREYEKRDRDIVIRKFVKIVRQHWNAGAIIWVANVLRILI